MRPILPLRFESIQTLRETATSSTFVATDHVLGRNNIVVKAIRKGAFTQDRSSLVDIFSWYRGLRHPHVAGIVDAGLTPKGDLFYVRDFAPSTQLFSTRDLDLLNALLGAVDFLHSMGRVHGSIKPSNVLASSKSVQLSDPWIPQLWKGLPSEEDVRFSAPEVLKGQPRTIESDLYSVGALLYRFFSGRDLFDDADLESLSAKYIWASPRPLTSISYVSRAIADIVESLVDKDPAQRRSAFESLKNELHVHSIVASRSPAIGMTEALEKAERFLQTNEDRLRILVVEGPVGFGKTRYIEELRHRMALQAPNLAFSVCPTAGRSPEITVAQWLLSVFERHCSSFDDLSVQRLEALVGGSTDSVADCDSESLVHDLVDVVTSVAQKYPLTLVVEDFDRTNKKLGRLIHSIVSRATRLRLCIVLTSRPAGIAPKVLHTFKNYVGSGLEHISLGHLDDADAESIASFLERDDDRRLVACEKAGGNPLFLEEYCKNQKPMIPPLVRSTMSKLVSALPQQSRRIAEVLSLFEEPVSLDVLQQVAGIAAEDLEQHLLCLRSLGFSNDILAIRHQDTRALLHSRIPSSRRTALHALCYEHLKDSQTDKKNKARHAYFGGLVEVAARLYLELAHEAFQLQAFNRAACFYDLVRKCRQRSSTVTPGSIEEFVSFAKCRAYMGDHSFAQATLKPLLAMQTVQANPELLSSVYSALASQFIEASNAERIRLLHLAIASLEPDSPTLAYRYGSLANAFLGFGKFDSAEMALDKALACNGEGLDAERAIDMRAVILMNRGKFKEAANSFSHRAFEWAIPLSMTMNLAVCLEQIGAIREARQIYINTLREAKSRGAHMEAVCLGNLASVESKLGNTSTAQRSFESAVVRFERIREQKLAGYSPSAACYSDAALHFIALGNYKKALHFVTQLNPSPDHGSRLETFQFLLTCGELYLALGNLRAVTAILDRTREFSDYGEFFEVERLLLRAGSLDRSDVLCNELREAVQATMRLETRYQLCRVLIALAKSLSLQGDLPGSRRAATEALELALTRGYRLLAAQALLRRGLAEENDIRKHSDLMRCLQEASHMGLHPLLAECALHFGAWRACHGDYPAARDYLFKSVSITARLAEDLSPSDRKRFLSLQPHKEARRLFEDATTRTREFQSVLREPLGKEDLFFGTLYRLTSATTSAPDVTSTVSTLIHSIRQCIQQTGAVMLESGVDISLYPLSENSSEEMKQRAKSAFGRTDTRTYFTNLGKRDRQGSAIWVPMPCLSLRGGIYIECSELALLDEQEIQFLTLSAAIAAAALDRTIGKHSRKNVDSPQEFPGIIGVSAPMKKVYTDIRVAASNSATVLIEGESGTGKELVAKAIHSKSLRGAAPFVPVDCGALPEDLIEAELFGARKGSFTGATEDRRGLFEEAHHGTIFLDEIANASLPLQTKLLRVLQEREIRRVGDTKGRRIDVRLIAATNCNLERLVEEGRFRQDLLFRLKVLHIQLPPLRKRKDDIPLLANVFLNRLNASNDNRKGFGPLTIGSLLMHEYPGNVRELQNAIEQAFYKCDGGVIGEIELYKPGAAAQDATDETHGWFQELTQGRRNFWSAVRDRYKRRDISRERVLALVDLGLRSTQGNYKAVASMFKIKDTEYRRFMDFLRRNDCLLDFRPYRRAEGSS